MCLLDIFGQVIDANVEETSGEERERVRMKREGKGEKYSKNCSLTVRERILIKICICKFSEVNCHLCGLVLTQD